MFLSTKQLYLDYSETPWRGETSGLGVSAVSCLWLVNSSVESCSTDLSSRSDSGIVVQPPGMTMVCGAAASVLRQRRPPLANLSQSKVICFFSWLVSLGMFSWLLVQSLLLRTLRQASLQQVGNGSIHRFFPAQFLSVFL